MELVQAIGGRAGAQRPSRICECGRVCLDQAARWWPLRSGMMERANNQMQLTIRKIAEGGPAARASVIYSRLAADLER